LEAGPPLSNSRTSKREVDQGQAASPRKNVEKRIFKSVKKQNEGREKKKE